MLDLDLWFRQQFWLQLWKGPGVMSTYLSTPIPDLCRPFSDRFNGTASCKFVHSVTQYFSRYFADSD